MKPSPLPNRARVTSPPHSLCDGRRASGARHIAHGVRHTDYGRAMASAEDVERSVNSGPTWHTTFELERFDWATPERLELVGTFAGLREPPNAAPELVVRGGSGSHRLP